MSRFYSNMERDIFVKVSKTYLGVWDMSEVHLTLRVLSFFLKLYFNDVTGVSSPLLLFDKGQ